jgi:hypothetical protein
LDSLNELEFRGTWRPIEEPDREAEERRFAEGFAAHKVLAHKHVTALGRDSEGSDVLYLVPESASLLIVVHFGDPVRRRIPEHTYYSNVAAWKAWAVDLRAAISHLGTTAGSASPRPQAQRTGFVVECPGCARPLCLQPPLSKRQFRCRDCGVRFYASVVQDGRIEVSPVVASAGRSPALGNTRRPFDPA